MARISTQEFERLPLRVHSLMEGVPLHDVWAVDLLRWRGEVTLDKFLQAANKYAHNICGCSNLSALMTRNVIFGLICCFSSVAVKL
jgi:hypothetical protein